MILLMYQMRRERIVLDLEQIVYQNVLRKKETAGHQEILAYQVQKVRLNNQMKKLIFYFFEILHKKTFCRFGTKLSLYILIM